MRNLLANFRQLSRIAVVDERTVDDSLASQFNDFEDAMQYYTALKAKDVTALVALIMTP